jgi:arylformamidase
LEWIDISVPLYDAMVHWPSDPPVRINRVKDIERGGTSNVSAISMGAHSGTHMDAPIHFSSQGAGIDSMPLSMVIGRARVIGIDDAESIKPGELSRHGIRHNERVLFKTCNSSEAWKRVRFAEDFVFLSDEAADFLVEHGLKVGDIARVIHVYPTYSVASMQAAADMRVAQLLGGTRGKIIRRLVQLMR